MRKQPLRYAQFLALAKAARLPNAHGRALYAINAHQNGRFGTFFGVATKFGGGKDALETCVLRLMRRCRPSTARTWAAHYASGGSLKSLRHGGSGRVRKEK